MGEGCTGTDTNLCEPKDWLDTQKDIATYEPCIFKPPSPDVASNCGGYLRFKDLPKDWCSELSEYAICGVGDGIVSGSGYDCKFEPHKTGSCKQIDSGNECNKLQIDTDNIHANCHFEEKEMDCGESCPSGWEYTHDTGCGCCSSVFDCGHCHNWCRKRVCPKDAESAEITVGQGATFDGSQGRSDKVLQDSKCACPMGRRELLVNPTSLDCMQGYKLKPDSYEYQCSDGSWIDCSGPSWICMGPNGELAEPSIRKDIHSIFYNASAAMDSRLVLILAVLGICSSLFYGVQYARKLFVAEYTPIFEAEA